MRPIVGLLITAACGGGPTAADGGTDASVHDVKSSTDVVVDQAIVEAGRTPGTALQTNGGCATSATSGNLDLTNVEFTIELWLRLDTAPIGTALAPILWTGGRMTGEPGWSFDVGSSGVVFCVASATASSCTSGYAITPSHLVHLVVRSVFAAQMSDSRTVTLYARDVTSGETSHANVGSFSGAPNLWTGAPFTVGGDAACTNAARVTIDDVRIYATVQSVASLDTDESVDVPCNANALLADFKFDEGSGSTTTDCASALTLTLGSTNAFVPSPFP